MLNTMNIPIPFFLRKYGALIVWKFKGSPIGPADQMKVQTVLEYANRFNIHTFIETGTYLGQMVDAVKGEFDKIYSIELDDILYRRARRRFSKYPHITIVKGDSGDILPDILQIINQPALFWLDAHFSWGMTTKGEKYTPILNEIETIMNSPSSKAHIILIDDAFCFNGSCDYPTYDHLKYFLVNIDHSLKIEMKDDIIRIHK
jgi:hypothetical protein